MAAGDTVFSRLVRTLSSYFRIGTLRLKDSSGNLRIRNANDSADVTLIASRIQLTNSPIEGYVLTTDADGLSSWQESALPTVPVITTDEIMIEKVLYDSTLGSNGSFDVSSIDQSYTHLKLIATLRSTASATSDSILMQFNNDSTAANYRRQLSTAITSTNTATAADTAMIGNITGATSVSDDFAVVIIQIPNYSSTLKRKTAIADSAARRDASNMERDIIALNWESTSAINRIQLITDNNPTDLFATGSSLQIIGIKEQEFVTDVSGISGGTDPAIETATIQVRKTLYSNTLNSSSAWDIQDIDQTYTHLEVMIWGRGSVSATSDNLIILANNDSTASNYRRTIIEGNSSAAASASADDSLIGVIPAASSPSNYFGLTRIFIPYYSSTSYEKLLTASTQDRRDSSVLQTGDTVVHWESTSAINRLQIRTDNHSTDLLVANSKIEIIGIKDQTVVTGINGGILTQAQQVVFAVAGTLTATAKPIRIYNRMGITRTISGVYLSANTAPSGSAIIADVNINGTTIFTTQGNRPQIADGANTGQSTSMDVTTWAAGDYFQIDVDQIGSGTAGSDLSVQIVVY